DRPRGAGRRHHTFSVFASRAEIFVAEVGQMKRGALTWCITLSAILCVILTAGWAWAQNAQGLAAVGTINAANGYPSWSMDRNGLQLGQCLETGPTDPCAVAAELPDPNQPVSFPGNFPPEFFYWRTTADISGIGIGGVGKAVLVLALEGSLGGPLEEPINGGQIVVSSSTFT